MKITIKNSSFSDPLFKQTLSELGKSKVRFQTALKISKILKEIQLIEDTMVEKKSSIIKENGVVPNEDGMIVFKDIKDDDVRAKFMQEITELTNEETELTIDKIPASELEMVDSIAPASLLAIESIIEG